MSIVMIHKSKSLMIVGSCVAVAIAGFSICTEVLSRDQPDKRAKWKDVDKTNFNKRQAEWPGNYSILQAISTTLAGIQSVRPDYSNCYYPLIVNGVKYNSVDDVNKYLDKIASNGKNVNRFRLYNINISSVTIIADRHLKADDYSKLPRNRVAELNDMRKLLNNDGYFVVLHINVESLQSDKTEPGPAYMYFIKTNGQWKTSYIHDIGH